MPKQAKQWSHFVCSAFNQSSGLLSTGRRTDEARRRSLWTEVVWFAYELCSTCCAFDKLLQSVCAKRLFITCVSRAASLLDKHRFHYSITCILFMLLQLFGIMLHGCPLVKKYLNLTSSWILSYIWLFTLHSVSRLYANKHYLNGPGIDKEFISL